MDRDISKRPTNSLPTPQLQDAVYERDLCTWKETYKRDLYI